MTDKLSGYSTTPASNNAAAPDGWPEGMTAGSVNNSMREYAARVREWYEDPQWIDFGHTIVSSTASSIKVSGDQTAVYSAGRAIRVNQSGSQVGHISGSAYSAPDTSISVTGFTVSTPTQVEVGAISSQSQLPNNLSITAASLSLSATLTVGDLIVTNASITTANVAGTITAAVATVSGTLTAQAIGGSMVAGQAAMEAATATNLAVTPASVVYSPYSSKAWGVIDSGGTLIAGAGISSAALVSTGVYSITFSNTFSSANYSGVGTPINASGTPTSNNYFFELYAPGTTSTRVYIKTIVGSGSPTSANTKFSIAIFGDLA